MSNIEVGHPLDRPVWSALTSRQSHMARGDSRAKRFDPQVSPFTAGVDASADSIAAIVSLIPEGGTVSLMERAPPPPGNVEVDLYGAGVQMVASTFTGGGPSREAERLGEADAQEMLDLATLTRPGPFAIRTYEMGRLIGVRHNGQLVAMAGERLQLDGYSEISGVCTHPDFQGRGLGSALLSAVGARILEEGTTPFLHTYASNTVAIALYERLGFEHRCNVVHTVWRRRTTRSNSD